MSALERIGFSVDWSNPLASKLDSLIRQAFNELGLDEELEKVTGDSELLTKVAAQWRTDALDMRGIVDDLVAERRALDYSWSGRAAKAFGTTMSDFEEAILSEAEDLEALAKLLEAAAEACTIAEDAMVELIVEVVQLLLTIAVTAAIMTLLTAGVAGAVGPLIAAAGAATRAMRAVRITAKLADKLSDLAERMQAVRKLRKAREIAERLREQKKNGAGKPWDVRTEYGRLKQGVKASVSTPLVGAEVPDAIAGAAPTLAGIAEHHGVDTSPVTKPVEAGQKAVDDAAGSAERAIHDTTGKDVPLREAPEPPPPARTAYDENAEPQRFRDRLAEKATDRTKSVQDTFV